MVVFDMKVSLLGTEPAVWRRVRVPGDFNLRMFHLLLQMVMGWENQHLHEFVSADRKRYGDVDGYEPQADELDEKQFLLSDLVSEPGDRCLYLYDFGDDWVHEVVLEAVSEIGPQDEPLWCLGGEGACPPENCGGAQAYLELLENLSDLDAVGHAEAVGLLGENFDPAAFDCGVFNERFAGMLAKHNEEMASEAVSAELDILMELQDFFESDAVPERAMSIIGLDGYFAALAINPVTLTPSAWLPFVWDMSGQSDQPEFTSPKEEEQVTGLLLACMDSVTRQMMDAPDEYAPLFEALELDSEEELMLAAMDWAAGFMLGAMIDEDVWVRTFSSDEGRDALSPFIVMSGFVDEESTGGMADDAALRAELIDVMGECLLDLKEFWEPWRQK